MALYHLTVKSGSRHKGASATRKSDYITRQNQYENQNDKCLHQSSGNMPTWAQDDARTYWQATDKFERANARLYVELEFALPRELDEQDRLELAQTFAQTLTEENKLPYTLSVHEGRGDHRQKDDLNPHAHLIVSERSNDGLERSKSDWFKRANKLEPEQGGALKSRQFHGAKNITQVRELFAELTNDSLERAQKLERVSHLSLAAQGLDRSPQQHHGPVYYAMKEQGLTSERENRLNSELEQQARTQLELKFVERQLLKTQQQLQDLSIGNHQTQANHLTGETGEGLHHGRGQTELSGSDAGRSQAADGRRDQESDTEHNKQRSLSREYGLEL